MIEDIKYGRTDRFEERTEWPEGMIIWNIGRHNFEHEGWLPLCYTDADYHVDSNRLVAFYVPDEDLCLEVMRVAGMRTVNEEVFNQIKEKYYGNKAN